MTTLTAPTAPAAEYVAAYGLKLPQVADARRSVERVYRDDAPKVWAELLATAGVHERDEAGLERIVAAMEAHPDGVLGLCARSLVIRMSSFRRLAATHAIVAA